MAKGSKDARIVQLAIGVRVWPRALLILCLASCGCGPWLTATPRDINKCYAERDELRREKQTREAEERGAAKERARKR